ncbi:MAG: hypothetical protein IT464_01765 [Planctomycetes bacterium]|nr:hypothetical protein [Planctomycetota bacterium]
MRVTGPEIEKKADKTWQVTIELGDNDWDEAVKALSAELKKLDGVTGVTVKADKKGVLFLAVKPDQLLVKNVVAKAVKNAGYAYKQVAELKPESE